MARNKVPEKALYLLEQIPRWFIDDGCSNSPDKLFWKFDFRWACRVHDWYYCTRCWPPGEMDYLHKNEADLLLRDLIKEALPWRWRWIRWVYFAAVWRYGGLGSFDSCGPEEGDRCRHWILQPKWMKAGGDR